MQLIERYLFRQFLGPIGGAIAALTIVAVLSQSLASMELIVQRGQSAAVLAQVVLFSLPELTSLILPIAVFVGLLISLNRLHTEHEFVACFAGGMSRWRATAAAIRLGVILTLVCLVANLFLQPLSAREKRELLYAAKTDLAATLVREGEFVTTGNMTIYTQRIDQNGLLRQLFIHIASPSGDKTYSAQTGRIINDKGNPSLIMRKGTHQELNNDGFLNYLSFDEYAFDLGPYVDQEESLYYKASDRWVHELVFPNLEIEFEARNRLEFLAEGHARIASPLYVMTFIMLALVGVLGGSFSRVGYGKRIATVAAIAAATRIVGFGMTAASTNAAWLNVLQYLVPLIPLLISAKILFGRPKSTHPQLESLTPLTTATIAGGR
ncbi:MAG: LptF/LptG family permease [Asticcacaulis sp.]